MSGLYTGPSRWSAREGCSRRGGGIGVGLYLEFYVQQTDGLIRVSLLP